MNVQEQEERDYFPQSEMENAYALSRITTQLRDPAIDSALKQGKIVVVMEVPAYCVHTDAFIGMRQVLAGEFDRREDANAAADSQNKEASGDYAFLVEPVEVPPIVPASCNDDIPF